MSISIYIAILSLCSCQSPDSTPLPEYTSEEKIDQELYMVNDIWEGRGEVIVGKIQPLPSGKIACRTAVYQDGSFTAAVAEGRELTFYLHGHDKLLVEKFKRIKNSVSDAGIVSFAETLEANFRQWQIAVEAPGFEGDITATLNIPNTDHLFTDHGYSGGARPFAKVESKKFKPGETLRFEGLSPIPYRVVFSGPGLVRQEVDINPDERGLIEADPVELGRATVLEFTFRTRTKKSGEDWKEDQKPKREIVVCDGKSELPLTDVRDGLGNTLELRLKPSEEGITASYVYYGDENFIKVGEGEITNDLHWDDVSRESGTAYPVLESGHCYLLQIEDYNDIDLETLFSVKVVK